jgi:hypothetical protein
LLIAIPQYPTTLVSDRNFAERLFSFLIFEGVKPGDGAIELLLCLRITGDLEVHLAEHF